MFSAIVLAAGSGKRMRMSINKQYLTVAGKTVLSHSLKIFGQCPKISEVILVIRVGDERLATNAIQESGYHQVQVVYGGDERQDSVRAALQKLSENCRYVLIHDGARPLLDQKLLDRLIENVDGEAGIIPVLPVKDTIKRQSGDHYVAETISREGLVAVQTPQLFPCKTIQEVHEKAKEESFFGTDDASLLEHYGISVKTVLGDSRNIKMTTPEDISLAEYYFKERGD